MRALVQCDPRTCCTIQQAFEVEACELVLRMLSDVSRERGNSFWIAGFELGRSIQIALGRGVVVLLAPERLEGPQRFGPAPQDQVSLLGAHKSLEPYWRASR